MDITVLGRRHDRQMQTGEVARYCYMTSARVKHTSSYGETKHLSVLVFLKGVDGP